jgi:MacB-like protein
MRDIRYVLRQFLNAPVFTLTVVLTLAIGIGATTAIFTLVHAVLLNSLPVAKPSELYRIGDVENCCVNGGLQDNWSLFSYDKYRTFRDNTSGFLELAAFQSGNSLMGVRRSGSPQPAQSYRSEFVSGNYFAMLGVAPFAGRVITPQDDHKGAHPVAVKSAELKLSYASIPRARRSSQRVEETRCSGLRIRRDEACGGCARNSSIAADGRNGCASEFPRRR